MNGADKQDYVVLARKYRSQTFGELIGQDALVRTLTNAVKSNKLHHAYVLTGIRGVGKTSTARLLAMALNCENGPSVTWNDDDPEVAAIRTGTHVDVLEYDAASNRGVDEVSALFEGVHYAPVQGRYKVYIIDEVHMLSNHAFNALLKTLEEPPPRVKFVFATTEVQKIPVTVLSRCQRFDLKRVPADVLQRHFEGVLAKEGIEAEPAAVQMVAKAADGSVRDGLSLLDQAMALSDGAMTAAVVQEMLGLADRARVYTLLEAILQGNAQGALAALDELYALGVDAALVLEGMLEAVHLMTRLKVVPSLAEDGTLTEMECRHAVPLAEKMAMPNMARFYQLALHAMEDVKLAARPYEALQMAVVRMVYLAPLPPVAELLGEAEAVVQRHRSVGAMAVGDLPVSPVVAMPPAEESAPVARAVPVAPAEEVARAPWEEGSTAPVVAADTPQPAPLPTDWAGVVALVDRVKPALGAAIKQQVRCEAVDGTELRVKIEDGLYERDDVMRSLRTVLGDATGTPWAIKTVDTEVRTLYQDEQAADARRRQQAASDPMVADVLRMFPGAQLVGVEAYHEVPNE